MASLSLRIDLDPGGRVGPGKIALLEHVAAAGSISAGARQMGMSYKHAWDLIEDLNRTFGKPVLVAKPGGKHGGGAQLTTTGLALVASYRAIERDAHAAATLHLKALQSEIAAA